VINLDEIKTKMDHLKEEIKKGDALTADYVFFVLEPLFGNLVTEINILQIEKGELLTDQAKSRKKIRDLQDDITLLQRQQPSWTIENHLQLKLQVIFHFFDIQIDLW